MKNTIPLNIKSGLTLSVPELWTDFKTTVNSIRQKYEGCAVSIDTLINMQNDVSRAYIDNLMSIIRQTRNTNYKNISFKVTEIENGDVGYIIVLPLYDDKSISILDSNIDMKHTKIKLSLYDMIDVMVKYNTNNVTYSQVLEFYRNKIYSVGTVNF